MGMIHAVPCYKQQQQYRRNKTNYASGIHTAKKDVLLNIYFSRFLLIAIAIGEM